MLISQWHSSSTGWHASSEAASDSDFADSRQPLPLWPAALQRVSTSISTLTQRSALFCTDSTALGSNQLVDSQVASLLAAWAPDIAAAEPHWRQLCSYAATLLGNVSTASVRAQAGSDLHPADRIVVSDVGVGGKVRAISPSRRSCHDARRHTVGCTQQRCTGRTYHCIVICNPILMLLHACTRRWHTLSELTICTSMHYTDTAHRTLSARSCWMPWCSSGSLMRASTRLRASSGTAAAQCNTRLRCCAGCTMPYTPGQSSKLHCFLLLASWIMHVRGLLRERLRDLLFCAHANRCGADCVQRSLGMFHVWYHLEVNHR